MKKLIFIDDTPLDHFILKRILNNYQLSYEVKCTADSKKVLEFLDQHKSDKNNLPDVILLDIYMPHFDGWEFINSVQHLYASLVKPLKIYLLSSSINPDEIQKAKQYSCVQSFIYKPITKEALERLVTDEASGTGE